MTFSESGLIPSTIKPFLEVKNNFTKLHDSAVQPGVVLGVEIKNNFTQKIVKEIGKLNSFKATKLGALSPTFKLVITLHLFHKIKKCLA